MASKAHYLVYDLREPDHPDGSKLTKAKHSSLENAIAQAQVDLEGRRNVVHIEDAKGSVVWEP